MNQTLERTADEDELAAQDNFERQQRGRLAAAPDCRDPAHPGCSACDDSADEAKEELKQEFISAAIRDMKAIATFARPYRSYCIGASKFTLKQQTMGEVMFETLVNSNSLKPDAVFQLLAKATNGEDIKDAALDLIGRMADEYVSYNSRVAA